MAKDDPFADIYAADKPDPNNPFADIYTTPPTTVQQVAKSAWDVAKQIPTGLALGAEAVATFPAQALGFVGKLLPAGKPEIEEQQAKMRELAAKARGEGLAGYLPKPETTAGKFARTATEFIPSAVGAARLAIPRAAGVGATSGVVSEAAGQATEGSALEPYARVAGALVGGIPAARMAEAAAATKAAEDTLKAARAAGDKGFKEFRNAGFSFDPQAAPTYTQVLKANLANDGMTEITAGKTWQVLDAIEKKPFLNPQGLQARYKELGAVAKNEPVGSEGAKAARIAQERLLAFAENPPPWVVAGGDPAAGIALLRRANADWAAQARAELVHQRIATGELKAGANYSGLNLENELRRRIGSLGLPEKAGGMRGATEAERKAFISFGEGTLRSNAPRYVKNLLGGGGGLGALATAGTAGGAGAYYGLDPLTYGGAVGLAGLGLAKYGNLSSLQRARELELMLLRRSPSAAAAGIPGTRSNVPYTLAPPTLATMGEY